MKKFSFALALACIFGLGLSLKAQSAAEAAQPAPKQITTEEDSGFVPEVSIELDWRTKYVSKGKIINPDHNVAVDVRLDLAGFYAEIWSPIDMTSQNDGYKPAKYARNGSGSDFIFCTVGEEEGFVGSAGVLLLFLALILRLIYLSERQPYRFGRVYGYSVLSIFLFHVFINVGMVLGLTPVIGIPLPFFSYGGSSLWGFTLLLFIFLRIDASRNLMHR